MFNTKKTLVAASALAMVMGSFMAPSTATAAEKKAADPIAEGKELAWNRGKGNCLACHAIAGASMPGNMGPPLVAMKIRYPDKQKLYDVIYDITETRPGVIMPPFGKHKALTEDEIAKITDYIYTL